MCSPEDFIQIKLAIVRQPDRDLVGAIPLEQKAIQR